ILQSAPQEAMYETRYSLGLLVMRQMAGTVNQLNTRIGDPFRELLGVGGRDDAVSTSPDDQRRRGDAVDVLLQPLVRDRPNEFAGARQRPGGAGLRLDPSIAILG